MAAVAEAAGAAAPNQQHMEQSTRTRMRASMWDNYQHDGDSLRGIREDFDSACHVAREGLPHTCVPWNCVPGTARVEVDFGLLDMETPWPSDQAVLFIRDRGCGVTPGPKWLGFSSWGHKADNLPQQQQELGISQFGTGTKHGDAGLAGDVFYFNRWEADGPMAVARTGSTSARACDPEEQALCMPYALVPSQEMHGLFQEALEAQAAGRGYNMARNLLGRVGLGDGGAASARRDLNDPSSHGCLRTQDDYSASLIALTHPRAGAFACYGPDNSFSQLLSVGKDAMLPDGCTGLARLLLLRKTCHAFQLEGGALMYHSKSPTTPPQPLAQLLASQYLIPPHASALDLEQAAAATATTAATASSATAAPVEAASAGMSALAAATTSSVPPSAPNFQAAAGATAAEGQPAPSHSAQGNSPGCGAAAAVAAAAPAPAAAATAAVAAAVAAAAAGGLVVDGMPAVAGTGAGQMSLDDMRQLVRDLMTPDYFAVYQAGPRNFNQVGAQNQVEVKDAAAVLGEVSVHARVQGTPVLWQDNTLLRHLHYGTSGVLKLAGSAARYAPEGSKDEAWAGSTPLRFCATYVGSSTEQRAKADTQGLSGPAVYVGMRRIQASGETDPWAVVEAVAGGYCAERRRALQRKSRFHYQATARLLGGRVTSAAASKRGKEMGYEDSRLLALQGVHVALVFDPRFVRLNHSKTGLVATPQTTTLVEAALFDVTKWVMENPPADVAARMEKNRQKEAADRMQKKNKEKEAAARDVAAAAGVGGSGVQADKEGGSQQKKRKAGEGPGETQQQGQQEPASPAAGVRGVMAGAAADAPGAPLPLDRQRARRTTSTHQPHYTDAALDEGEEEKEEEEEVIKKQVVDPCAGAAAAGGAAGSGHSAGAGGPAAGAAVAHAASAPAQGAAVGPAAQQPQKAEATKKGATKRLSNVMKALVQCKDNEKRQRLWVKLSTDPKNSAKFRAQVHVDPDDADMRDVCGKVL